MPQRHSQSECVSLQIPSSLAGGFSPFGYENSSPVPAAMSMASELSASQASLVWAAREGGYLELPESLVLILPISSSPFFSRVLSTMTAVRATTEALWADPSTHLVRRTATTRCEGIFPVVQSREGRDESFLYGVRFSRLPLFRRCYYYFYFR